MQCIPDLQQDAVMILLPLVIPEPQFLNALCDEKFFSHLVSLVFFRHAVLKSVEFDG